MKQLFSICMLGVLMSCSKEIDEHFITDKEPALLNIVQESLKSQMDTIDANDDHKISKQIRGLGMEGIRVQYNKNTIDYIGADSLIYFEVNDGTFLNPQKYIIYDFSVSPRKFGNAEFVGASYSRKQVSDRWYFETIGFD